MFSFFELAEKKIDQLVKRQLSCLWIACGIKIMTIKSEDFLGNNLQEKIMKMTTLKSVAIAVGLASPAFGQAVSPVVGYETLAVEPGFNFLGLRLHEKLEFSGSIVSVSGTTVTLGSAPAVSDGLTLFEVTTGAAAGSVIEIVSVAGSDVTLSEDLSAELVAGDGVDIRASATLETVFGANNEINLTSSSSFGTSDQVLVPDGSGGFDTFAFVEGNAFLGTADGWQDADGNSVDPADINLVYTDSVLVNSVEGNDLVISGALKTTPTTVALTLPFNFIGTAYPVGVTLATAFGANNESDLESSSSFGTSDQVLVPDGSGGFNTFAFVEGNAFLGTPAGWQDSDGNSVDATTVSLGSNSGIIVNLNGEPLNVPFSTPVVISDLD